MAQDKNKELLTTSDGPGTACCSNNPIPSDTVNGPNNPTDGYVYPTSGVPTGSVGDYTAWGAVQYSLCSGSLTPQIQFEGQFNSAIRGLDGWNVGILNTPISGIDLDEITCEDIIGNITMANCNVVGSKTGGVPGYYTYVPDFSIDNYVVVWKYDDTGAMKVYVIQVTDLIADNTIAPNGDWTSGVDFSYICLVCTDCVISAEAAVRRNVNSELLIAVHKANKAEKANKK